jgi:hypothetical protein
VLLKGIPALQGREEVKNIHPFWMMVQRLGLEAGAHHESERVPKIRKLEGLRQRIMFPRPTG